MASGSVTAQPYRRHRHQEFLRALKLIDAAVLKDLDLHLLVDDYASRSAHRSVAELQLAGSGPQFTEAIA